MSSYDRMQWDYGQPITFNIPNTVDLSQGSPIVKLLVKYPQSGITRLWAPCSLDVINYVGSYVLVKGDLSEYGNYQMQILIFRSAAAPPERAGSEQPITLRVGQSLDK